MTELENKNDLELLEGKNEDTKNEEEEDEEIEKKNKSEEGKNRETKATIWRCKEKESRADTKAQTTTRRRVKAEAKRAWGKDC